MDLLVLEAIPAGVSAQPVRVLVVDDSADFLVRAIRFLRLDPAIEVVGTANSGSDALEQVISLQPHVVLMDINLPDMSGLQATQQIKAQPNAPCVVISTLCDNQEYRAAAQAVSADGLVPKSQFGTEILPLLRKLCDGRIEAEPPPTH